MFFGLIADDVLYFKADETSRVEYEQRGMGPFQPFEETERLFEAKRPGNPVERCLVEIGMITKGSREGGFFMMIGKKI